MSEKKHLVSYSFTAEGTTEEIADIITTLDSTAGITISGLQVGQRYTVSAYHLPLETRDSDD